MNRMDAATLAIRPAVDADAPAVIRLAALDSAQVPAGPLLLGLLDARAVVALALVTGAVVADPFTPTLDVIALVRARAERLNGAANASAEATAGAAPARLSAARLSSSTPTNGEG